MRRDALFLAEMIDAAEQSIRLVEGRDVDAFGSDRTARDALLWNFLVIGEAATKVSADTRDAHPEVPWRLASALRNRIVHGYWSIDLDVVHATAQEQLPGFTTDLRRVLAALADQDDGGPADRLRP